MPTLRDYQKDNNEMTHDQQVLLGELLQIESGLSAWEMDFLESLEGRVGLGLTEKQAIKLNDIADKHGLGGLI